MIEKAKTMEDTEERERRMQEDEEIDLESEY